ncbi:MAG: 50S ribosomal protein L22 [Nanoarchaeota archaeon]|nr:50S ribosomal protein L22 [Nanoarchaeota archaeon]
MEGKLQATAKGMSLPISRKQAVEVCRMINRRTVEKARWMLDRVINLKSPVPATKFKRDIPHRKGSFGPGRFHVKTSTEVLKLINSAVSNAEVKGMKGSSLVIVKASACKGPTAWRYGRQSRRHAKRTHVEIVLEEAEAKKGRAKPIKAGALVKEAKPKAEVKAEAVKEVVKEAAKAEAPKEVKKPAVKQSVKKPAVKAVKEDKPKEEKKEVKESAKVSEQSEGRLGTQAPKAEEKKENTEAQKAPLEEKQ